MSDRETVLATEVAPMEITHHPASIVSTAQTDVVNWYDILKHETVIEQGVLADSADRGSVLFIKNVSPRYLQSKYQKSILAHLAEIFTQWHGTIRFRLIMTIPYFVATKVVFAFAPNPVNLTTLSPSAMAGLQNSCILNPSNNYSVELPTPFLGFGNWQSTTLATGYVAAKLLEPVVSSMEFKGGLPWTLMVSVNPSDFRFRYLVPPPAVEEDADSGTSSPTIGPTLGDRTLAKSMSTKSHGNRTRADEYWPLTVQPRPVYSYTYESMMLIPRSRIEFVMQKVRGQYPAVNGVTSQVADMFDVPAFTFKTIKPINLPHPSLLYPYLSQPYLCNQANGGRVPFVLQTSCPVNVENDAVGQQLYLHLRVYSRTAAFDSIPGVKLYYYPFSIAGALALGTHAFTYQELYTASDGTLWHKYKADTYADQKVVREYHKVAAVAWDVNFDNSQTICSMLAQIDSCPAEVTHLALYTTMPPDMAAQFCDWLVTADNTSPPAMALSYSIAFSPNQSQLSYNGGRFHEELQSQRGIVWKLFKLFKGDETKWWAWLVRGLDVVVDALIGAFLGRSSVSQVVPIGEGSGFTVEAVGEYDKELITKYETTQMLEYIPKASFPSLISVASETPVLFRRRKHSRTPSLATRQESRTPLPTPASSLRTPSQASMASRSTSRSYRAAHPSSHRSRFRRFFRGHEGSF